MAKSDPNRGENQQDIRFDRDRSIRIEHHSAKGHLVRNVGSFTRGTQLIRLEYMMVWQGVKVPLFLGFGTFILLLCGFMIFRMHEHETQLVMMRVLAGFWSWCDLSPDKMVDLTLPSGDVVTVSMANIRRSDVVAECRLTLEIAPAAPTTVAVDPNDRCHVFAAGRVPQRPFVL